MPSAAPPPVLAELLHADPKAQRAFAWNKKPWQNRLHDLPDVLDVLEALPPAVDRDSTRLVVHSELKAGRVLPAFVAAMIWGYGRVGYGPARVRWVFTGTKGPDALDAPVLATVSERLAAGGQKAREGKLRDAFYLMNNDGRIKYLGSAFFTKWLYFASALSGPDDPVAAPILDKRVVTWLDGHKVVPLRLNNTASYITYLDILANWGERYGRTRVQVEKAIFGLATGRN